MPSVMIGADRILRVDGNRFFPIAARHMPAGADYASLRQAGFNAVRWTPFGVDGYPGGQVAPQDLAGLFFYPYLYTNGDHSRDQEGRRRQLRDLAEAVREREDLLCYEQRNEPAYTPENHRIPNSTPEGLIAGSACLRELDQRHPIRIGHMNSNLVSTLRRYNAATDIVGCNPYVVMEPGMRYFVGCRPDNRIVDSPNQTLSAVGDYTTKMMRVAEGRPVWMQIQGSANENWFSEVHTPANAELGLYPHHQRYPTRWEMRYMAFSAIVRGATGLEWMLIRLPYGASPWQDVSAVVTELASLHDSLAAPSPAHEIAIDYQELGFSDFTGVEFLLKRTVSSDVLIAVNTQFDPFQPVFSNLPERFQRGLEVVGENREVAVEGGQFTDRFQPYGVHVYRSL
jgi:hypothetical protein